MQRHDLSAQMKRLSVNSPLRSITSSKTAQTKEQLVPIKTPLTQQRPASPKTRRAPPAQMGVSRYIDQCLPNCLTSPQTVVTNLDAQPLAALQTSPTASVVKRPNGTAAHLLKLPPSVPYAIRLHSGSAQGTVHVLPCLSPAATMQIREDAERTAERLGGWRPRAVGCCTNDVLVSQLSSASQQLIFDAFRRVILPFACKAFPDAKLSPDSLPSSVECFFIIKYKADKTRREFGEHTDHTKITVNISLTSPEVDFKAGGLFFPCAKGLASDDPSAGGATGAKGAKGDGKRGGVVDAISSACGAGRLASQSKGLLLRAGPGTAIIHHGDVKHAGDRIEAGERLQLVAFFYGNERRGNALPAAIDSKQETEVAAPKQESTRRSTLLKPTRLSQAKAASTEVHSLKEPQRLLHLDDIRSLAK